MTQSQDTDDNQFWRRKCGCIRTSEKLKQVLATFPAPPPPTPARDDVLPEGTKHACISVYCSQHNQPHLTNEKDEPKVDPVMEKNFEDDLNKQSAGTSWMILREVFRIVQMAAIALALVLYYLFCCYMQFLNLMFQSLLFFHNADGPMRFTIAVVTATTVYVGFNYYLRIRRFLWIV